MKEFLQAAGIVIFAGFVFTTLGLIMTGNNPINESTFEVVDKYKECDVVRYAPHQVAEYKYFLYCEKNK